MREKNCKSFVSLQKSFTLIELLVVIAIIAILAAMLMPALRKAQEAGKLSSCLGNVRQVGTAVMNYGIDNKDLITPVQVYLSAKKPKYYDSRGLIHPGENVEGSANPAPWLWYVWDYIGNRSEYKPASKYNDYRTGKLAEKYRKGILRCPAGGPDPTQYADSYYGMVAHFIGGVDYDKNGDYIGKVARKFGAIKHASKRAYLADSISDGPNSDYKDEVTLTYDMSGNNRAGSYIIVDKKGGYDAISTARHGGRCNIYFADGHAATTAANTVYQELAQPIDKGIMFYRGGY